MGSRTYEPPLIEEGTPIVPGDEGELYPGVRGYAVDHVGEIYIPLILGEGDGQVGNMLDDLSPRCRIVNVTSQRMLSMLHRRGWVEYCVQTGDEVCDVWKPPKETRRCTVALSDYLTNEEWDACYYVAMIGHKGENFGDSMQQTIEALLANNYSFRGLDEHGMKLQQVGDGVNAPKVLIFLGNPNKIDTLPILENGRSFLKQFAPALVVESDEIWAGLVAKYKRLTGE